jgi:hypothetical protein
VIPLTKDGDFSQGIFDPAIGVLDLVRLLLLHSPRGRFQLFGSGSQGMEFVLVVLGNVGSALPQFSLEASPDILFILLVSLEEQPNGFFCAQLGNSGEIFNTEAI